MPGLGRHTGNAGLPTPLLLDATRRGSHPGPCGNLDARGVRAVTTLTTGESPGGRARVLDDDVDLVRDRLLVERAQAGDRSAFDDLYQRYYRRLHRFCLRRLQDDHEAEDVAQESFARAWRALPSFAGDRRFYPWLSVIAAHLCTDVLRRRSRATPVAELHQVNVASTEDGGEERVVAAADSDLVAQAFRRLSERHRRILQLREGSGWSYQRIADHEGIAITATETLLWRARQALKREFTALADGDGRTAVVAGGFAVLGALRRMLRSAAAASRRLVHAGAWTPAAVIGSAAAVSAVVVAASVPGPSTTRVVPAGSAVRTAASAPSLPGATTRATTQIAARPAMPASAAPGAEPSDPRTGTSPRTTPTTGQPDVTGVPAVSPQSGIADAGSGLGGAIGTVGSAASSLADGSGALPATLGAVGSTASGLASTVSGAGSALGTVTEPVGGAIASLGASLPATSSLTTTLGSTVGALPGALANAAAGALTPVGTVVNQLGAAAGQATAPASSTVASSAGTPPNASGSAGTTAPARSTAATASASPGAACTTGGALGAVTSTVSGLLGGTSATGSGAGTGCAL